MALEVFDGVDAREIFENWSSSEPYERAQQLKEYTEELVYESGASNLVTGWATAFLSEVNWPEIAENLNEAIEEAGAN